MPMQFELCGKLLGLAIYNSVILDIHFPLVIYKKLLGEEISMKDLIDIEPEVYKGLKNLLEYEGDVKEDFCLNFQTTYVSFGQQITYDLKVRSVKMF